MEVGLIISDDLYDRFVADEKSRGKLGWQMNDEGEMFDTLRGVLIIPTKEALKDFAGESGMR